ncbi:MAG: excinuclease ABC subunit UvrA [Phycisphaerae bacterium]|nr:excinuclease ABC subunit UvrA [Phycisphaerae bacterium]
MARPIVASPPVIRVRGAKENNLQDISIDIPRDRLTVITGLSGSGKSTLAFDTIYAEGQRKYVESLSVHARHFLEQVGKPDVEQIDGLPPTLAIGQFSTTPNPRSIVATTTEIYDFLRVLYSRVGSPHCPQCARPLMRRTVDQIVNETLALPPDTRLMILAPLTRGEKTDLTAVVRRIQREGFVRARVDGRLCDVAELTESGAKKSSAIDVVIDRLQPKPAMRSRLADAVELAMRIGDGVAIVSHAAAKAEATGGGEGGGSAGAETWLDHHFSERFACSVCNISVDDLSPRAFSFNSPYGACAACDGLGTRLAFAEDLIVPEPGLAILGGAIAPWRGPNQKITASFAKIAKSICAAMEASPEKPWATLTADVRRVFLHGSTPRDLEEHGVEFEGIIPNLQRRAKAAGGDGGASRLAEFQAELICETCRGARLKAAALAVRVEQRGIADVTRLPISEARAWFDGLKFAGEAAVIAAPVLREIRQRLRFLDDVGLGYLTLDRASATLSGGEAQRIRLATQIGAGLVGVCYVLDEPTIGLHQRDNERLLKSIRGLVDAGNTAIVVEHDEDVIRAADYLIDMGPGAGLHGGRIISSGPAADVIADPNSITGRYISGEYGIPLPEQRRPIRRDFHLQVIGARENNLKNIDVSLPLGAFVAITGVSGSGKSTLISQILLPAVRRRVMKTNERAGAHERLVGANRIDRVIEIDQTPIGRTPRSNPATFTGVFDEIRELYAKSKEAKIRGYDASRFSFNVKGGRCEACQGQGTRRIEMHFLPDVFVECQECKGTRYARETLEVRYRGKSIAEVLEMRVEDALGFFDSFPKILHGIRALSDVGLGYVRLGQPSNTLSGGEAQRVKLAGELCKGTIAPAGPSAARGVQRPAERGKGEPHTLYVLDEPTSGLHFADIQTLLAVLERLVDRGHSVVVIEHNLDVIKVADWVIDLGPEGGDAGGQIVAQGRPEDIARVAESFTGQYLKSKLGPGVPGEPVRAAAG